MTSTQGGRRESLRRIGTAALLLAVASVTPVLAKNPLKLGDTQYEPINWAQIDGWADDDHDAAFATYLKSCKAILSGEPSKGQPMFSALYRVCEKAQSVDPQKPGEARAFFEQNFRPVRISPLSSPEGDGFITGYYEPIVDGVRAQGDGYDFPLYRRPSGVGASVSAGKKKKKVRRKLAFYDRAAIDDGALAGRDLEICWLKDPIDSFFIHIQGSVRVVMDDGKLMRLNYSAANGHPYYAVGRWLIDKGIIDKEEMSMDRIREWMERNPEQGKTLRRMNKSYVFFRETHLPADQEPVGAQGISLTPGRSIAVDRKLHVYGTPFFISAYLPIEGLKADTWFKRLMVAQDTGGAIVGPARADIYFGAGDEAASVAGRLRHYGKFVMLAPRELMPATDDDIPLPVARPNGLTSDGIAADSPEAAAAAKALAAKHDGKESKPSKTAAKSEKDKSDKAKKTAKAEDEKPAAEKKSAKSEKSEKPEKPKKTAKVEDKPAIDKKRDAKSDKAGDRTASIDKKKADKPDKPAEKKADKKSDKAADDKKAAGAKSKANAEKSKSQATSRHEPPS
jgi:membrane-bound lytic murein transglycosylase A